MQPVSQWAVAQYWAGDQGLRTSGVEEEADAGSTLELVSISYPCDLAQGVQVYAEQQRGLVTSPWYIPHLMATCVICLELTSSVVFPLNYLGKFLVPLILCSARHSDS